MSHPPRRPTREKAGSSLGVGRRLPNQSFGALLALALVGLAGGATGAPNPAPGLAAALDQLARTARIELLFDRRLTAGKRAGPVAKGVTPEQALAMILRGSGLVHRRASDGSYLILAGKPIQRPLPPPGAPAEAAVAEILVVARAALNADIRRDVNDTQPYEISSAASIERSQSATVDDFLRTRLSQNGQATAMNQAPRMNGGAARSQVDLRGLGPAQTLVLIDGRRLPSIPANGDFLQADINALPTSGIDRIETLGSTAGGIFGIGAAGGAINLVTASDYTGIDLTVRTGIAQRGDAGQRAISGHIGVTSPQGHTKVSLRVSRSEDDGLTFGDRSYIENARLRRFANAASIQQLPVSSGINIASQLNLDLRLLPIYGGASLGSQKTYLPIGAPAVAAGGAAMLLANAGQLNLALAPDAQGSRQSFLTPSSSTSFQGSIRQQVGSRLVLFADYLRLSDTGVATTAGLPTVSTVLDVGESGNPFAVPIRVTYPTGTLSARARTQTVTDRLTLGAIVSLGRGWTANIDAATGQASVRQSQSAASVYSDAINVFAGQSALAKQLAEVAIQPGTETYAANRLHDLNMRVAGRVLELPAGPLSLTVTGEYREERAPGEIDRTFAQADQAVTETRASSQRQRVASVFGELRAPLVRDDSGFVPLRGLELQLAMRRDRYSIKVPVVATDLIDSGFYAPTVSGKAARTSFTASGRVRPIPGLMLRASFADGYTPPTPAQMTPSGISTFTFLLDDPKRGGSQPFTLDEFLFVNGGSPNLKPAHARTLSTGIVLSPSIIPGLRLSIDYSVLRTTQEVSDFANGDYAYFIANEAEYPDRVIRAPLTDADRARGYTGGKILLLDTTSLAIGRSEVRSLDAALEYSFRTTVGAFRLYGQGTWEPVLRHRDDPAGASYNSVDHVNGPLAARGNAGLDWSRGQWGASVNVQAYSGYEVTYAYAQNSVFAQSYQEANREQVLEQGTARIPPQAYIDLSGGFRASMGMFGGRAVAVTYRLGVKNLLDTRPPLVASAVARAFDEPGYSVYGDPRGRRFELDVGTRF